MTRPPHTHTQNKPHRRTSCRETQAHKNFIKQNIETERTNPTRPGHSGVHQMRATLHQRATITGECVKEYMRTLMRVYKCRRRRRGLYLVRQRLTGQVNSASVAWSWEVRRPAGSRPWLPRPGQTLRSMK